MALAILRNKGANGQTHLFEANIGTNRFFQYQIGKREKTPKGLSFLGDITYKSPLLTADHPSQQLLGVAFKLEVPNRHFKEGANKIQLLSFKRKDGTGLAISEIISVLPKLPFNHSSPLSAFALSVDHHNMQPILVKHKSFSYQEPGISRSMFWGALLSALPTIISTGVPLVKKLLGGKNKTAKKQTGTALVETIAGLLKQLINNQSTTKSVYSAEMALPISTELIEQLVPLLEKVVSPATIQAIGNNPIKLFKVIGDAVLKMDQQQMAHLERLNPKRKEATLVPLLASKSLTTQNYSEAKIAPALLAALPALAPLVTKILNPKTIATLGNQPLKLFSAITDAVLKMDQQQKAHLEKLHTIPTDNSLLPILASMSIPSSLDVAMPFSFNTNIEIDFVEVKKVILWGMPRVVYSKTADLYFPIKIGTKLSKVPQKAIPKAIIQAVFQDSDTDAILYEKKFKLKEVRIGDTLREIVLTQAEAKALPTNKDIKMELSFIWRGSNSKKNRGAFKIHHFTIAEEYVFDRIGEKLGEPIPLNDLVKHRAFWHKVWEGGFTNHKRWEIDLDVKYYYALDTTDIAISKLETRRKTVADNANGTNPPNRRKMKAKLKSGLEVSIEALNQLLPALSYPTVEATQLKALKSTILSKYYSQVARINVEMKGRSGDTGTLWTYPEICIHNIHLSRIESVNERGQVEEMGEEIIPFPRPSMIHFIGTKSM